MTPAEIKERLREAADVLRRLPPERGPREFGSNWPDIVRSTWGALWRWNPTLQRWEREVPILKPSPPMGAEIDRMEEVMTWIEMLGDSQEIQRLIDLYSHSEKTAKGTVVMRRVVGWGFALGLSTRRIGRQIGRSHERARQILNIDAERVIERMGTGG